MLNKAYPMTIMAALTVKVMLLMFGVYPSSTGANAGELVLVEEGIARAPVVVVENAADKTVQAAQELAEYIEKISGVRPDLIEGNPDPLPESAVWVGYQPVLEEFFPGVNWDFEHPEEILLTSDEKHLAITGRDLVKDGVQLEFGTANAVYTFLQDYLDVRWLWPGELGEDIVEQSTIALAPFKHRYHPQVRGRTGMMGFSAGGSVYGISEEWKRYQRVALGSLPIPGGHAFSDWWGRYHETDRDLFALQPDGSRAGDPGPYPSARTVKLCKSNPKVWEKWMEDVERQIEQTPSRRVFNAAANDGWFSGWCICEDCREWDHPEGEPRRFNWSGVTQNYFALSDRQVTFANILGGMLKERFPEEEYYVHIQAYGHSRPAPVEAVPEDNVLVASVANFLFRRDLKDRGSTWGTTHVEQFKAWGEVTENLGWRPNVGNIGGWGQGLPHVPLTETAEEFQIAAESGFVGLFIDAVWEHWATQGPLYYLIAQMLWNPQVDVETLMEDYYQRAFGPAEQEMEAYWRLLETKSDYDEDFFENGYEYINQALKAVEGEREIYRERIEHVKLGLDYTRLQMDTRKQMSTFEESGGTDTAAEDKARENWLEVRRLAKENPYAINWGPIRPRTSRSGPAPEDLRQKPPGW